MKTLIISLKIFLFFTVLTGIIYPLLITGIAQIVFPAKANGSLIDKDNQIIGSELIGQQFDSVIYFTSRPSAISYNPLPSGGSNYGLTNTKLKNLVAERKKQFIAFNQLDSLTEIPSEMLFASASGLDPHISAKGSIIAGGPNCKSPKFQYYPKAKLDTTVLKTILKHLSFYVLVKKELMYLLLKFR